MKDKRPQVVRGLQRAGPSGEITWRRHLTHATSLVGRRSCKCKCTTPLRTFIQKSFLYATRVKQPGKKFHWCRGWTRRLRRKTNKKIPASLLGFQRLPRALGCGTLEASVPRVGPGRASHSRVWRPRLCLTHWRQHIRLGQDAGLVMF